MVPLARFRIIELGIGPVSGMATMILADFGADVVKVVPKEGDPFAGMGSWPLWSRGKRIVRADLRSQRDVDALRRLIVDSADAVLTTLKREQRERLGIVRESLRDDLVLGVVSGFGEDGPYAGYPGYEPVVAAKSGRMLSFAGVADRAGPNYAALQVGTHATAQAAAAALLAALIGREAGGHGFTFDTSLLRGMMPYEMGIMAMAQLWDKGILERPKAARDRTKSMPTLNYHPVRTKDGKWLQLGNLLPHLLANFFRASGLAAELKDPQYRGDPMRWPREALEAFRDRLFEHMQTRTLAEWTELFVADGGVVSHPYQTTQEALEDPDVTANAHVVEASGGKQLGLLANLTETPGSVGQAAVETSFDAIEPRPVAKVAEVESREPLVKPLAGVTVVESATIIAAPLGASMLADLGARVIKLEPLGGDPFRSMFHGFGAAKCNAGKESIGLDLKSAEGQRIARSLAAKADIWIHNYRVGVPEKLGIGYQDLAAVNPGLVYVSANGYGPKGPGAKRPSTHPIPGAALGGVVWQLGGLPPQDEAQDSDELRETARKLLRANEVNPDPNTSMVVATTALLGLAARRTHGAGQKIFIDMFGANAYANWDDFLAYPGKPERPPVDAQGFGTGPLQRLYPCRNGWVFLMVVNDAQWNALRAALSLDVERDDARVEHALAAAFQAGEADDFERRLAPQGIGCVRADGLAPPDFFLNDPHCAAEELRVAAVHPDWGDYYRNGPMARFSNGDSYAGASALGDSTTALLEELGYSANEIAALIDTRKVAAREAA